jgi:hypothetical protein
MSPFHTPRCRITSTLVESNLVFRDDVEADKRLALFINAWLDPTLLGTPGTTVFDFRLVSADTGEVFSEESSQGIVTTPLGNMWWLMWKDIATDWTFGNRGWFLYEPRVSIFVFRGVPGAGQLANVEFAYPEEPHHIYIRQF